MLRTLLIIAAIWLAAAGGPVLHAQTTDNRIAVLVGISRYPDVEGIPGLRFGDRDALQFEAYLRSERGGHFSRLLVLLEEKATRSAILAAVKDAVVRAGPTGEVFLFFSARGSATTAAPDGSIFTWESAAEKSAGINKSAGLTLPELQQALQGGQSPRIFLVADLCRTPAEWLPQENRINFRLEELARNVRLTGLLASEGAQRSYEDANLDRGHGVFSYFTGQALGGAAGALDLNHDQRIDFGELAAYLRRELPQRGQYNRQKPRLVGIRDDKFAVADLAYPVARVPFPRAPGLLAFAGAQDVPLRDIPTERLADTQLAFDNAVRNAILTGPNGAEQLLGQLRTLLNGEDWAAERGRLEALYEGQAQQIFLRYGTGDRFPDDPKWRQLETGASDFTRAEQWFRDALRLHSQDSVVGTQASLEARALFCAGRAAMLAGDRDTARRRFAEAITAYPALAEPHNALGVLRLEAGDYAAAATAFGEAHDRAPGWAFPLHNLALTDIETGDFQGAEHEYEKAIAATPYYPYLYYNLAVLYHRLNRTGPAERTYRKSIEMFVAQAAAYQERARQWAEVGRLPERDRAAAFADVLRRNEAEAHNGLAVLYEARHRRDQALREYRIARAANPALLAATHNLALIESSQGNRGEALSLLRQNAAADPDYLPSRMSLAGMLVEQGSFAEAERQYREVLAIQAGQVEAEHGLAAALAGQSRLSEAIEVEKALVERQIRESQTAGGRFYEALGDFYGKAGDAARACSQYRMASRSARNSEFIPSKILREKLKGCR